MVYPVVVYGDPVLRKRASDIPQGEDVKKLVSDMFETMVAADGIGLAAPQIGKSIRLFVVDATMLEDEPDLKTFRKVFINAQILDSGGKSEEMEEGCLSIPNIRENIRRDAQIRISWYDENWVHHEEDFSDMKARIIQHEYDHIEGKLFLDHLTPLRRRLLQGKLNNISKGKVDTSYRILAPLKK
jgi:peptide deformylase